MNFEGPPGFENDIEESEEIDIEAVERNHLETLTSLEDALNSEDDTVLDNFVSERLDYLKDSSEKSHISGGVQSEPYTGFIHPETSVHPSALLTEGIHLDDDSLYEELIDSVKTFRENPGFADASLRQIEMYSVQYALSNYFGNYVGSAEGNRRNAAFYSERSIISFDEPQEDISIAEMKGEKMAVCPEKSAAAQNMLTFMGAHCELIAGSLSRPDEAITEGHYFNVIKNKNGSYIYDPTNPVTQYTGESGDWKSLVIAPAIYKLSDEQVKAFNSRKPVEVNHKDFERTTSEDEWQAVESKRVYSM